MGFTFNGIVFSVHSEEGISVGDKVRTLTDADILGKRVYVIGDIHGCFDQFMDLLRVMNVLYSPLDPAQGLRRRAIVILAGDLVNKGPYSEKVMEYASRTERMYIVRGNHEQKYIEKNPGSEWVKWIEKQPYLIRIPFYDTIIAHAGMMPSLAPEVQDRWVVTHMRNIRVSAKGNLKPVERTYEGRNWGEVWSEGEKKMVVYGHDAGRGQFVQRFSAATGLDTRCVKGGRMTAVELPVSQEKFYEVECSKGCF